MIVKTFLLICLTRLACLAAQLLAALASDPLDQWHERNPDSALNHVREVRFSDGYWVAINRVEILGSLDGTNWVRNFQAPEGFSVQWLEFGAGRWIATLSNWNSDRPVLTSTNGYAWTAIPNLQLRQISHGNGRWVGIGGNGKSFVSSSDGIHWKEGSSDPDLDVPYEEYSTLAFGHGQWLAVRARPRIEGLQRELISSTDGETWAVLPLPKELRHQDPNLVTLHPALLAFGNGNWLLQSPSCSQIGGGCTTELWKSQDGRTWEKLIPNGGALELVHFSPDLEGGRWFGRRFGASPSACVSRDLSRWDCSPWHEGIGAGKVVWAGGRWAISEGWSGVFTSTNGLDWVPTASRVPTRTVAYDGQKWLGLGTHLSGPWTSYLLSSADARQWSVVKTFAAEETPAGLAYSGGLWVIGGTSRKDPFGVSSNYFVLISTDGKSWMPAVVPAGPKGYMRTVRHTEKGWIAFVDAYEWQTPSADHWLLRSPDGQNWNWQQLGPLFLFGNNPIPPRIVDVTFGNGSWHASAAVSGDGRVRVRGYILASDDLVTWRLIQWTPGIISPLEFASGLWFGIAGPGFFQCCGEKFSLVTSTDGQNWTQRITWLSPDIASGVTLADGRLTALLSLGSLRQSDPLLSLHQNIPGALTLRRAAGMPAAVEFSEDLQQWHALTSLPQGESIQSINDPVTTGAAARFYRARTP